MYARDQYSNQLKSVKVAKVLLAEARKQSNIYALQISQKLHYIIYYTNSIYVRRGLLRLAPLPRRLMRTTNSRSMIQSLQFWKKSVLPITRVLQQYFTTLFYTPNFHVIEAHGLTAGTKSKTQVIGRAFLNGVVGFSRSLPVI